MEKLDEIVEPLLEWYYQNKRVLPWRDTQDPYAIWVSEIMLQQTRVEAVKPYYTKFLQTLPTIKDLAQAEEETILKLWEGLGYYSRVKNMQQAAIQVVEKYDGYLPPDYEKILQLKGIGSYTAGAISSIAYGLPTPAVDGNVLRVMSRITADSADISLSSTKKKWEILLKELISDKDPGGFNQALMELGAVICIPNGEPFCSKCPVRAWCEAYRKNSTAVFPVKAKKNQRVPVFMQVFFCVYQDKLAIKKRTQKGLLSGLWELPNIEKEESIPFALQELGIMQAEITPLKSYKHIFTHIEWHMDCYYIKVKEKVNSNLIWITPEEVKSDYALPSAFKKIWLDGIHYMNP